MQYFHLHSFLSHSRLSALFLTIVVIRTPYVAHGATRYVDVNATGAPNDGTTWCNAFVSLQDALAIAVSGDEVRVADGTYRPDEGANQTNGDRAATFQLVIGVTIKGGYAGCGAADPDVRNTTILETILSGDLSGDDASGGSNSENSYHVVTASGASNTFLDGVVIERGNADVDSYPDFHGGGVLSDGGSPTIVSCTIRDNRAINFGGGIFQQTTPLLLQDSLVSNNVADSVAPPLKAGGGLALSGSPSIIVRTEFRLNSSFDAGGVLIIGASDPPPTFHNCRFVQNSASRYGGGVQTQSFGRAEFVNCLFHGNNTTSDGFGGALRVDATSFMNVVNCTIARNSAWTEGGGGALDIDNSIPGPVTTITNGVIWENTDRHGVPTQIRITQGAGPAINHTVIQGGWTGPGGTGVLSSDPLFEDPGNNNYRLKRSSPCIDSGNNSALLADSGDLDNDADLTEMTPVDLDDSARRKDDECIIDTGNGSAPIVDMGAYEFGGIPVSGPVLYVDDDATSGANDGSSWSDAYSDLQDALAFAAQCRATVSEIWVASGVYAPATCPSPPCAFTSASPERNSTFQLIDGLALYGGFSGNETLRTERGVVLNGTVLTGDLNGDDDDPGPTRAENSKTIVRGDNTSPTARLDGFTVQASEGASAVGIFDGAPTIVNCRIRDNVGGAVWGANGSPRVINCVLAENSLGAAASFLGAGSVPYFNNCVFTGNTSGGIAASMDAFPYDGPPTVFVENCTFSQNFTNAPNGGGAIRAEAGSTYRISNCILWNDTQPEIFDNQGFGLNDIEVNDSIIQDGWAGSGSRNVDVNPAFVDASGVLGEPAADLRLSDISPAIDAGNNALVQADLADLDEDGDDVEPLPFDLAGDLRFIDDPFTMDTGLGAPPIVDFGAFEFRRPDCDDNGVPDECEVDCGNPGSQCDVVGCGEIVDCNGNQIPDSCDIAGCAPNNPDCSDCNANMIPDGCELSGAVTSEWAGGTTCGMSPDYYCWDESTNWCPQVVPDNGLSTFDVTIDLVGAVVTLDTNPTITSLSIGPSADLEVNERSLISPRFLGSTSPIANDGVIRARDGRRFLLDSADVNQSATGVIEATGTGSEVRVSGRQVSGGTVRGINGGVVRLEGTLIGVTVEGVVVPTGSTGSISGAISTQGDFTVAGTSGSTATLQPTAANASLEAAGGRVRLSDQNGSLLGSVFGIGSLTNASGHVIEGEGLIVGAFTNGGDVVANASGRGLTLRNLGVTNHSGRMIAENGGRLYIESSVTGTGEFIANGGTIGVRRPPAGVSVSIGSRVLNAHSNTPETIGIFRVADDASASFTGPVLIGSSGAYEADPASTGLGCEGTGHTVCVALSAGSVTIQHADSMDVPAGSMVLEGAMSVTTSGNLTVDASGGMAVSCVVPPIGQAARGGRTPPILRIWNASVVAVGNTLSLLSNPANPNSGPHIFVDSSVAVSVAGDFVNQIRMPECFDWSAGSLVLNGPPTRRINSRSAGPGQIFEVAGADFGSDPAAFENNFAIGQLRVSAGSQVTFTNQFANQVGVVACEEALYVLDLILEAGSAVTLDNVRIYYQSIDDQGAEIQVNGCGELQPPCAASSTPQAELIGPDVSTKNRFLSFSAGEGGRSQAVRVTFDSLPAPFDLWNGAKLWVGPTSQVSDVGANVAPTKDFTNFAAATLQCLPFYTDWSLVGVVHVFHEGIVPAGSYLVQVVDAECMDPFDNNAYSAALPLTTAVSGDTVTDLSIDPPLPPNGPPIDVTDALAILERFSNAPGAIVKARADLEPACLDLLINVSDVLSSLAGFAGVGYRFTPTAGDPCDSTCANPLP